MQQKQMIGPRKSPIVEKDEGPHRTKNIMYKEPLLDF